MANLYVTYVRHSIAMQTVPGYVVLEDAEPPRSIDEIQSLIRRIDREEDIRIMGITFWAEFYE